MNIDKFELLTGAYVDRIPYKRGQARRIALVMPDGTRIEGRTIRDCMKRATQIALLARWPRPMEYDEDLR